MPPQTVSEKAIYEAALQGLQHQHSEILEKMTDIRRKLGIRAPRTISPEMSAPEAPAKRTMGAGARKRIAAAQRKRWANLKKEQEAPAEEAPKKRRISAEGMKRIIAATKKRWAAVRAKKATPAKKAAKPVARKAAKKSAMKKGMPKQTGSPAVTAAAEQSTSS
jgi:hypothetical protein